MKNKYIEERFDGPWHNMGIFDCISSPTSPGMTHHEMMERYNKLLQFTADIADAFDKADPQAFRDFYYGKPKERIKI